ncbi:MAG: flagellar M-ring protein FliF [Planctomycetes bacterium]|nr:flagellar M-ring protein FliF [Planctomycetota bacterium]
MNYLENISVVWQKLSLVQRAMLMAILVAGGITAVFLTKWASKPDMRPLYTGLSPEDASKVTEKVAEKGIPYVLRGSGSIYVPKEHVYQLRNDCAGAGLPSGDSSDYSLFSENKFGSSPFINNVNFKRAQEGELAKSIQAFDTITSARVHIVQPEQNPFTSSDQNSTASVILYVQPGFNISQSTVAAITHMVAGGVEGLVANGVIVVDSQGHLLSNVNENGISGSANSFMDYKERTEQRLAANAQRMLDISLGPGRSSIVVSAVVDMDSEETEIITYDKGVASDEGIETMTKLTASGNDTDGNPLKPDEEGTEKITTTYLIPKTVKRTVKMAGKIISVSVACTVDLTDTPPEAETAEGETTTPAPAVTNRMAVEDVEALIFNALGKDILTKENLTVIDVPFYRAAIPEPVKAPWHVAYIGMVKQGSLGIMAICALLALKIFSGKVKPGKGGAVAQLGSGGENAVAALPAGDMREQISLAYRSDPEQVKELFTSWIEEKG